MTSTTNALYVLPSTSATMASSAWNVKACLLDVMNARLLMESVLDARLAIHTKTMIAKSATKAPSVLMEVSVFHAKVSLMGVMLAQQKQVSAVVACLASNSSMRKVALLPTHRALFPSAPLVLMAITVKPVRNVSRTPPCQAVLCTTRHTTSVSDVMKVIL